MKVNSIVLVFTSISQVAFCWTPGRTCVFWRWNQGRTELRTTLGKLTPSLTVQLQLFHRNNTSCSLAPLHSWGLFQHVLVPLQSKISQGFGAAVPSTFGRVPHLRARLCHWLLRAQRAISSFHTALPQRENKRSTNCRSLTPILHYFALLVRPLESPGLPVTAMSQSLLALWGAALRAPLTPPCPGLPCWAAPSEQRLRFSCHRCHSHAFPDTHSLSALRAAAPL